jgi:ribosomal protein S18 acetylase RimI-like enzyme
MIVLREAQLPKDMEAILTLDASFTTAEIYTVYRENDQMGLRLVKLSAPITKRFSLDDLDKADRPWEFAAAATADGRICGFIAAGYEAWNRRITIWHLYVDGHQRKQGIARLLVDQAEVYARTRGALNMWLETSSLNVPAVRSYRRLGFELCGLDTILYQGTPAANETALFFARPILPTRIPRTTKRGHIRTDRKDKAKARDASARGRR